MSNKSIQQTNEEFLHAFGVPNTKNVVEVTLSLTAWEAPKLTVTRVLTGAEADRLRTMTEVMELRSCPVVDTLLRNNSPASEAPSGFSEWSAQQQALRQRK